MGLHVFHCWYRILSATSFLAIPLWVAGSNTQSIRFVSVERHIATASGGLTLSLAHIQQDLKLSISTLPNCTLPDSLYGVISARRGSTG